MSTNYGPLRYLWPLDDYMNGATPTTAMTADAAYPVTNVGNQDPQDPFKTTSVTGNIDLDLGSAKLVQSLTIIHSNLKEGLTNVKFQGGTSAGASDLFNETVTIPLRSADPNEAVALRYPTNAVVVLAAPVSARYLRLAIGDTNVLGITIGEIIVGAPWRSLEFMAGVTEDETHPNIKNASEGGGVKTVYEKGYRMRWLRGTFRLSTHYGGDGVVRAWRRAARDDSRPFLIREGTHEPMFVRFEKPNAPRKRAFESVGEFLDDYPAEFEEASRGLPPEP